MKALKALRTGEPVIVVAPVSAALKRIAPHEIFEEKVIKLAMGEEADLEKLRESLTAMGYEYAEMVESQGQFSIRGGIIDIFTPDSDWPYRVELFGTEVDSIRTFNQDTQRSLENLKFIEIYPAKQLVASHTDLERGCRAIRKEYEAQAKRFSARKSADAAAKLSELAEQICEYIENVSDLKYLENYIHYFYDRTEFLWVT